MHASDGDDAVDSPWADGFISDAMALLDDWDDSSIHLPDCASSADPARAADALKSPSRRRTATVNHSRARQKQEILELQQHVVELQAELERLQERNARSHKRPRAASQDNDANWTNGTMVVWENVARRQLRSRRKAETLNAKLHETLATHRAVAEDLIRVIQRAEHVRQAAREMTLVPMPVSAFFPDDPVSDPHLRRRLTAISQQWHVPFTKCAKFHDRPDRPRDVLFYDISTTRSGADDLVLDIRASTPTAFPLEAVEQVLWQYFLSLECSEDDLSLSSHAVETVDTIVGSLCATASHDGIHGVLQSRFMKQRFRNADGELVIATAFCGRPALMTHDDVKIDAVLFEDSWLRVVHTRDHGVMKPDASVSSGVTVIQHVRRSRIEFCGLEKPDRARVDAVERFFTRLAKNEQRWSQEVIERSLMLAQKNVLQQG